MFSFSNRQLGPYHLIRRVGGGGMGEVYLAEDRRMGITRQVAIKTIRAEVDPYLDQAATQDAERLFRREMQAIIQLDHPFILPLYDFGEEKVDDTLLTYMVMPFRPEGSLANWLQKRDATKLLSLEETAHFVGQAAEALSHAHTHELIHQDVKPANFLLRNRSDQVLPDILLADFGIVKIATATATASQSVRGTPAYMAPEQWNGHPVPATDQYALAIMAYLLLTRHYPFKGSIQQVMRQHLDAQPQAPSTANPAIPSDLDEVLLRALRKAPEERFASISAFANAFQQAARPPTMSASPPPALKALANEAKFPPIIPTEVALPFPSSSSAPQVSAAHDTLAPFPATVTAVSTVLARGDTRLPIFPETQPSTDAVTAPPTRSGPRSMLRSRAGMLLIWGVLVLVILASMIGIAIHQNQSNASNVANTQATTSASGTTWRTQSSGTPQPLYGIAWSGSQFIAVGDAGTILTSPDGSTWTAQSSGASQFLNRVAWSGSQFVAVGKSATILTSPDGNIWSAQSLSTSHRYNLNGIAWSGSQFMAVGDAGTILTSPDGSTWTAQFSSISQDLYEVAWSGSQFVAVGKSATILTSPDGNTWTYRTFGIPQYQNNLNGIAWSGSQFVAVGGSGTILTSPNGNIWMAQSSGTSQDLNGVVWSGSQFVIVGESGTILTSLNGNTWTVQSPSTSQPLVEVAWSGSQFVTVGYNGTILTST